MAEDGRRNPGLTPEQRSERARKAVQARWAKAAAATRGEQTVVAQAAPGAAHDQVEPLLADIVRGADVLARRNFSFTEYLPEPLVETFERATANTDYLSNQQHSALIDLRISQVLRHVNLAESGQRWRETLAALRDLTVAMQSGAQEQVVSAFKELNVVVRTGAKEWESWGEVIGLIEARRRVGETEMKRIRMAAEFISSQEAHEIIQGIAESVARHVDCPLAKARIAADIERIIGAAGS